MKKYNGFHFATAAADRTVNEITEKFEDFAVGEVNVTYERFKFNSRKQETNESFEEYLSTLRYMLRTCAYCGNCSDGLLRDRILLGVHSPEAQKQLLQERNLTLVRAIDICRSCENADKQGNSGVSQPIRINGWLSKLLAASRLSHKLMATAGLRAYWLLAG